MALDLSKKQELVKLVLAKRRVPESVVAQVKTALDVSGSMQSLYDRGVVQTLVDRLIPIGMRFDDNQSLEAYGFASDAAQTSDIKPSDAGNYIPKFLRECRQEGILWGGTSYSRLLRLVKDHMTPKKSMFGLFKKDEQNKLPSYLKFITDGETNNDKAETEKLLQDLESMNIYVQMIGVGNPSYFSFLKEMADKYDHVGFVTFPDLSRVTDEEMYEQLLSEEFCNWIKNR